MAKRAGYDANGMHMHGGSKGVFTKPNKMARYGHRQSKVGRTKNFKKA